ncbi:MAG: VWA domain-containing protein [Muribaculaceae bacterium]|nr:VWA domain-containing protein [Muribaculaceae bacterium]
MNFFDLFGKKKPTVTPEPETVATSTPEIQIPEGATKVHNLIILDESGSMTSIYRAALIGVNNTLKTIRTAQEEHPDQYHLISLISFDSEHYNQIFRNAPALMTGDIRPDQYRPCGGTPLYDTMGRAINELRRTVKKGDIVLVTIITDGYENASHEYNSRMIHNLVTEMKAEDWIFTYIGADQDVEAVSTDLGINNCLAFEADEEGTTEMWEHENACRSRLFSKLSHPNCSRSDLMDDYFNN